MRKTKCDTTARAVLVGILIAALSGCESIALTAFGVGASTGVQHSLNGVNYRTFTAPAPKIKTALLGALRRMDIKVDSVEKLTSGELIRASTSSRKIELELERISPNTTRLRAVARQEGVIYDSATAIEIILQTERILGNT